MRKSYDNVRSDLFTKSKSFLDNFLGFTAIAHDPHEGVRLAEAHLRRQKKLKEHADWLIQDYRYAIDIQHIKKGLLGGRYNSIATTFFIPFIRQMFFSSAHAIGTKDPEKFINSLNIPLFSLCMLAAHNCCVQWEHGSSDDDTLAGIGSAKAQEGKYPWFNPDFQR